MVQATEDRRTLADAFFTWLDRDVRVVGVDPFFLWEVIKLLYDFTSLSA